MNFWDEQCVECNRMFLNNSVSTSLGCPDCEDKLRAEEAAARRNDYPIEERVCDVLGTTYVGYDALVKSAMCKLTVAEVGTTFKPDEWLVLHELVWQECIRRGLNRGKTI